MTIDEMFNELENKVRDTYIVTLKYKYDFEENYVIENQILEYDSVDDSYVWLNDWNEGQTDIEVLGYMLLGDVDTTRLLTCEDCISREAVNQDISYISYEFGTRANDIVERMRERCKKLSSVTPHRKVGRWLDKKQLLKAVMDWLMVDMGVQYVRINSQAKLIFAQNVVLI